MNRTSAFQIACSAGLIGMWFALSGVIGVLFLDGEISFWIIPVAYLLFTVPILLSAILIWSAPETVIRQKLMKTLARVAIWILLIAVAMAVSGIGPFTGRLSGYAFALIGFASWLWCVWSVAVVWRR